MQRLHSNRIAILEKQIKWAERYSTENSKQLKEELAELLKEEQEREVLRKLPLYSSRVTGYRWVCSRCWDQVYWSKSK
ncbi:MAG: hypothetical protein ACJ71K_18250 [Nitrososphaeraceae archaeon]